MVVTHKPSVCTNKKVEYARMHIGMLEASQMQSSAQTDAGMIWLKIGSVRSLKKGFMLVMMHRSLKFQIEFKHNSISFILARHTYWKLPVELHHYIQRKLQNRTETKLQHEPGVSTVNPEKKNRNKRKTSRDRPAAVLSTHIQHNHIRSGSCDDSRGKCNLLPRSPPYNDMGLFCTMLLECRR